jgi:hypothetical protein
MNGLSTGVNMKPDLLEQLLAYAKANPGTYIFPGWDGDRIALALKAAKAQPRLPEFCTCDDTKPMECDGCRRNREARAAQPVVPQINAQLIATQIMFDLDGRKGVLDDVDEETRKEMAQTIQGIIAAAPSVEPPAVELPVVAEEQYFLQDSRSFVGNCPMWWAKNGNGYTTRIDEAQRYTKQEALAQHACRDTDKPWLCSDIEALARPTIDMQDLYKFLFRNYDAQAAIAAAKE